MWKLSVRLVHCEGFEWLEWKIGKTIETVRNSLKIT